VIIRAWNVGLVSRNVPPVTKRKIGFYWTESAIVLKAIMNKRIKVAKVKNYLVIFKYF
jgi:hypothetical protein